MLTTYTGKDEKLLLAEFVLICHFKTVIFNLFFTDNTSDKSLLALFPLLLTGLLSEPHHICQKKKLNYRKNEQ